jgi:hypothetical protein
MTLTLVQSNAELSFFCASLCMSATAFIAPAAFIGMNRSAIDCGRKNSRSRSRSD